LVYKRNSLRYRKYPYIYDNSNVALNSYNQEEKEVLKIPPPNEPEKNPAAYEEPKNGNRGLLSSLFRGRIQIDDIILIGLILLLFDEGMEDDTLMILLVYLLVS